jgi:hypothetical protein
MDLRRLVKWLAVLGLLALAWSEGRPWLEETLRRSGDPAATGAGGGAPDARRCVELARQAAGAYGDAVGQFARRRDAGEWAAASGGLHDRIADAGAPCGCGRPPCRLATEALRELQSAVDRTDLLVGASPDARIDPAHDLEGVYDLLDRARDGL